MNELCIHSYVWIPAWTTALGRVAAECASAAGFTRVVVPLSNQEAIDPPAIARIFGSEVARAGATIVRNAYRDFHSGRSGHPAFRTR
jgi:hypothetical protein